MEPDEKTDTYEETLSKTSDPIVERTITGERKSTPSLDREYRVRSETVPEDESVSAKAREAGHYLRELVHSIGRRTKEITEGKLKSANNSRDIQQLATNVKQLTIVLEDTITEIRNELYEDQEKLLLGYKKLLEEQINVINARIEMARRPKPAED